MTINLPATPGQTVGPFFAFGLDYPGDNELVSPHSPNAISLSGTVYDGAGDPIPDALVEIWQADATGHIPRSRGSLVRDARTFTGFGRSSTNAEGRYSFWTLEPGPTTPDHAPFIAVIVFARGLLNKLHTRVYLPVTDHKVAHDPLLARLSDTERQTLIAKRDSTGALTHDIHLQGEKETVFFAFD